jgi:hypothetical protein
MRAACGWRPWPGQSGSEAERIGELAQDGAAGPAGDAFAIGGHAESVGALATLQAGASGVLDNPSIASGKPLFLHPQVKL